MIVVNIVIDFPPQGGTTKKGKVTCNLLRREDANDVEWALAKQLEGVVEASLSIVGKVTKKVRIDDPPLPAKEADHDPH